MSIPSPTSTIETNLEHELVILFLHHKLDPVTLNNLESFRLRNPTVPIIPISGGERLPGGYAPEDMPEFGRLLQRYSETEWMYRSGLDVLIVEWYKQRGIRAKRWFLAEWDGWCGIPVREYLAEVWNADVAASSIRWPNREPEWFWFRQIQRLPESYRPYAAGLVPTCFTMLSDRALSAIAERLTPELCTNIIYEIRIPTLAHAAGYPPVTNPRAGWNVTWQEIPQGTPLTPTLWHAIKWLAPLEPAQSSCGTTMVPVMPPPTRMSRRRMSPESASTLMNEEPARP